MWRGRGLLRTNDIHQNAAGVYVYAGGVGVFEDNDIHNNQAAGVDVCRRRPGVTGQSHPQQRSGSGSRLIWAGVRTWQRSAGQ